MQTVLLTLCSALFFAVGHALQKHGVSEHFRAGDRPGSIGRIAGRPLWLAGFGAMLLASALDLQAVSSGDLTLVKPLLGLQAAFAVAIGVGLLGERVGRGEGTAIATLVAGAVLVVLTTGPQTQRLPDDWNAAGVFGASVAAATGIGVVHLRIPARLRAEVAFALAAGLMFGVSDFMMKRATSAVVAFAGHFSVLEPASLLGLLETPEVLWIALANAAAFGLMQLAYARGRVAVISPLACLSGTAFAVILGFSVLGEPLSPLRTAGIALVLAATGLLARGQAADTVDRVDTADTVDARKRRTG